MARPPPPGSHRSPLAINFIRHVLSVYLSPARRQWKRNFDIIGCFGPAYNFLASQPFFFLGGWGTNIENHEEIDFRAERHGSRKWGAESVEREKRASRGLQKSNARDRIEIGGSQKVNDENQFPRQ